MSDLEDHAGNGEETAFERLSLGKHQHRFFDPWRIPVSPRARAVVEDVLNQVRRFEAHRLPRARKRKAKDQVIFEATVTAIVCDLIHAELRQAGKIAISRSNRVLGRKSRYRPPALGKTLPTILDMLSAPEMDFVEQHIGFGRRFGSNQMTLAQAGSRLVTRVREYGISELDLGRSSGEEIIILKELNPGERAGSRYAEYEETADTSRMRTELELINDWLAAADIEVDGPGMATWVNTSQRRLRRVFTRGSFETGGRLFGGFWQEMKKKDRQEYLIIEESSTVELDFGQMGPRLLYGLCGAVPPEGDAYTFPEYPAPLPFRAGFKKLFNALLFTEKPLARKPKETSRLLPNAPISDLVDVIRRHHQPIAHTFETGVGHRLQKLESDILIRVLLALREMGIVGLPIHDAIIVGEERADAVERMMMVEFEKATGVKALVTRSG
jgi:hypothetical protein